MMSNLQFFGFHWKLMLVETFMVVVVVVRGSSDKRGGESLWNIWADSIVFLLKFTIFTLFHFISPYVSPFSPINGRNDVHFNMNIYHIPIYPLHTIFYYYYKSIACKLLTVCPSIGSIVNRIIRDPAIFRPEQTIPQVANNDLLTFNWILVCECCG